MKHYGWKGWQIPILHPSDPEYCEHGCPICRGARAGNPIAKFFQRLELILTGGGCPWGKARKRKYGVEPDQVR